MNGFRDITSDLIYVAGQTVKVFVPVIGITEGVIQTISGDPRGVAKIFVPGIGIVEGVLGVGSGVWSMVEGGIVGGVIENTAGAITSSLAPWLLIGGLLVVAVVVLKK